MYRGRLCETASQTDGAEVLFLSLGEVVPTMTVSREDIKNHIEIYTFKFFFCPQTARGDCKNIENELLDLYNCFRFPNFHAGP